MASPVCEPAAVAEWLATKPGGRASYEPGDPRGLPLACGGAGGVQVTPPAARREGVSNNHIKIRE